MQKPLARTLAIVTGVLLLCPAAGRAQQAAPAGGHSAELAKKLANPISDLVSVPFQFNWEQNVGPSELTRFILNVQPVMPFELNADWNLITRVIMPLVSQPPLFSGGEAAFGISDITTSFFLSPRKAGPGSRLGAGPVIVLPSTSEPTLGSGKWSVGPTVVALKQDGPWTFGALWNQVWSFSGDASRADVNQMFLQPFLAYQATHTVTLTVQSEMTANWEADDQKWTDPDQCHRRRSCRRSARSRPVISSASAMFPVHPDVGPVVEDSRRDRHLVTAGTKVTDAPEIDGVRVDARQEAVMFSKVHVCGSAAVVAVALLVAVPLSARQQPAAKVAGTPTETPTKKDPLRFSAFNVSMPTGVAGVTEITIERWTTVAERNGLLELVTTAKEGEGGQRKLLEALQKVKPRTGYIRTPNSIGWDLRYAVENKLEDGTRQIVIVTDKPVSFAAAASQGRVMDYPFTLIEMRMKPNEKGEGKMLAATSISTKNGRLELENYGQEPVRLTEITEEQKKKK